ncbi:MAG: hypothetical protein KA974_01600 [Saprospiraceae bacterium]|nr:hypothetical protein [Saprospiraceae bacterium]MBP7679695.1 hypothetical protein [Saprospiraceae bacterium]
MRLILTYILLLVAIGTAWAQTHSDDVAKGIIYNRENTVELLLHTNGLFGIGYNKGKIKTYYKTTYYHIDFSEIHHIKEYRQNPDLPQWNDGSYSRPYSFGKQNRFYVLRAGWGKKTYLSEKSKVKGVAIGYNFEVGGSLGLLKPYYLQLIRFEGREGRPYLSNEKYSDENASVFLDQSRIYGASSFAKGLSELKPVPGGHFRAGIHFDWGAFDQVAKALEVGVLLDVYPIAIPIMVNVPNRPFFANFYLTLQVGKRK